MNSKYLKYILIIGVVSVWAAIVYRVINGLNTESPIVMGPIPLAAREVKATADSFSLNADYPDPFLPEVDTVSAGTAGKSVNSVQTPAITSAPLQNEDVGTVFQLEGVILNAQKGLRVAIVKIKGGDYVVKESDKIGDFKIKKIRRGEILIVYKGQGYRIMKS